jgi:hypothetical protein
MVGKTSNIRIESQNMSKVYKRKEEGGHSVFREKHSQRLRRKRA